MTNDERDLATRIDDGLRRNDVLLEHKLLREAVAALRARDAESRRCGSGWRRWRR